MINCLIIEDERPAQKVLINYIGELPNLNLIKCLNNAIDATKELQTKSIDLIFLDIHLPKISGLNFLRSLSHCPKVIITTAYPEYALEGFELEVMDYLLKPFSFERFLKAVNKYPVTNPGTSNVKEQSTLDDFIMIKEGKGFEKIKARDINFIKSDGDLVKISTPGKVFLEFRSLRSFENDLPDSFLRVHKSYIVNLNQVTSIDGNQVSVAGEKVPIGRKFKSELLDKLNID